MNRLSAVSQKKKRARLARFHGFQAVGIKKFYISRKWVSGDQLLRLGRRTLPRMSRSDMKFTYYCMWMVGNQISSQAGRWLLCISVPRKRVEKWRWLAKQIASKMTLWFSGQWQFQVFQHVCPWKPQHCLIFSHRRPNRSLEPTKTKRSEATLREHSFRHPPWSWNSLTQCRWNNTHDLFGNEIKHQTTRLSFILSGEQHTHTPGIINSHLGVPT